MSNGALPIDQRERDGWDKWHIFMVSVATIISISSIFSAYANWHIAFQVLPNATSSLENISQKPVSYNISISDGAVTYDSFEAYVQYADLAKLQDEYCKNLSINGTEEISKNDANVTIYLKMRSLNLTINISKDAYGKCFFIIPYTQRIT